MNCSTVQQNLSLYLYQELDFAMEDAVESHLEGCSACQLAFAREKSWHADLRSEIPANGFVSKSGTLDSLRSQLFASLSQPVLEPPRRSWWPNWVRFEITTWSRQIALASFFLFAGAFGSRFVSQSDFHGNKSLQMSMFGTAPVFVKDVQPVDAGRVRIVVGRLEQEELVGSVDDGQIRRLLVGAARNSADPGLRVNSIELLGDQDGQDVRDALLSAAQHDPNSAVRLRAVSALDSFLGDGTVRTALIGVLRNEANPAVRSAAIDVLLPVNRRVEATPDLLAVLAELARNSDKDEYVRVRSFQILQSIGVPAGAEVVY